MSESIKWENPPKIQKRRGSGRPHTVTEEFVQALKDNPGKWAVAHSTQRVVSKSIKNLTYSPPRRIANKDRKRSVTKNSEFPRFQYAQHIEILDEETQFGTITLYVRYLTDFETFQRDFQSVVDIGRHGL